MTADHPLLRPGGALSTRLFRRLVESARQRRLLEPGARVGNYRIGEELGRGGSSVVYRAERADGAFAQAVALKIILATSDSRASFERERNILGQLRHPNIARIFDGGEIDDGGSLWFAMELVDGAPIDTWCRRKRVDWRGRVRLLAIVADAVQYAHAHLVVHRDLKPGNVLIDAHGHARLLDFGIAQSTDADDGDAAAPTRTRGFTPEFASPAQIAGEAPSTADDIHALGRLAEELLLVDADARELALPAMVRANLRALVAKATAADPARRHATAAQLAQDLERVLDGRAVSAWRAQPLARLRYFVRRRWLPLAVALAALATSAIIAVTAALRISEERDIARLRQETTTEASRFMVDLFSDPTLSGDEAHAAITRVLDRGRDRALAAGHRQPEVQSALLQELGAAYRGVGRLDDAEQLLARAVTLRRGSAAGPLALAESLTLLALTQSDLGRQADAITSADEARALLATASYTTVRERFEALMLEGKLSNGGVVHLVEAAEAEAALQQAADLSTAAFGADSPEHVEAMRLHGRVLWTLYRGEAARAESRRAVAGLTRSLGADDPTTLAEAIHLDSVELEMGDAPRIEPELRALLARNDTLAGDRERRRHSLQFYLGLAQYLQGRWPEATVSYDEAMRSLEALEHGAESAHWASDVAIVAELAVARGDTATAERLLRRGLAAVQAGLPESLPAISHSRYALGHLLVRTGQVDEAEPLLTRALDGMVHHYGPHGLATARARVAFAWLRIGRGDAGGARRELEAALEVDPSGLVYQQAEHVAEIHSALATIAGAADEAIRERRLAADGLAATFGADDPRVAVARAALAEALRGSHAEEARALVDQALPILDAQLVDGAPARVAAQALAAALLEPARK